MSGWFAGASMNVVGAGGVGDTWMELAAWFVLCYGWRNMVRPFVIECFSFFSFFDQVVLLLVA